MLSYDDALNSQLNIAIPQLDSANFKGTFFVCGNMNQDNIEKWRAVSKKGNELANHTLYHPCLSTDGKGEPANNSANYTVYTIMREVSSMNNFLFALDQRKDRSFAFPCSETTVGGISYLDSLRKSGLIKYARIGGDQNSIITDYASIDPLQVPSWGVVGKVTADDLVDFVKKVQKNGGIGIFMFHGIGGDYLTTPAANHKKLLNYLVQHKEEIWVTTFGEAMDYAMKNK
ncbi:polysaccharide deacetylase family protein [Mucilaginibacter sp. SP1R1]|uniref:polysaccharide deacetylase family protein n=1 Tax=Mucilaginibacter sp. SP1R1 TaxID=2723091 RepID=UPI003B00F95E